MLEDLLKLKLIKLPKMRFLEEVGWIDDPKYYKYHWLVSHLVKQCFVLKDNIMKFAYQENIDFEENVATSNIISKKFHKNKMLPFDSVKCVDGRTPQLAKILNNVLILISCKYKLASRSTYYNLRVSFIHFQ